MTVHTFRQRDALTKIIATRTESADLLSISATPFAWIETWAVIIIANAIAWGLVYAAAMGWLS